jgi:hypothetical protein
MLLTHCHAGRSNWASNVKDILYRFGFGFVWEDQSVENVESFLTEFKCRMMDCTVQNWKDKMVNMPKLRTLCLYKKDFVLEPYLHLEVPHKIRSALAKFRIGNHDLYIEKGRHLNVPSHERFCKLCISMNIFEIEDEYHVLLKCSFYKDIRDMYLDLNNAPVNLHTFTSILSRNDPQHLINLGIFVFNMFKLRKVLLESMLI